MSIGDSVNVAHRPPLGRVSQRVGFPAKVEGSKEGFAPKDARRAKKTKPPKWGLIF
jgi:hypothetical protein